MLWGWWSQSMFALVYQVVVVVSVLVLVGVGVTSGVQISDDDRANIHSINIHSDRGGEVFR